MFDRLIRKRIAAESVSAQQHQLFDKTNLYTVDAKNVSQVNEEKKMKMTPTQKVCLKCMAGESGHITHVLSQISN